MKSMKLALLPLRASHVDRGVANAPPPATEQNNQAAGRGTGRGHGERGERGGRGGRANSGRFHAGEGGRPVGSSNYSTKEVEHMLESIREYLPISGSEWDLVADRHSRFHPELERTADQLKKKFNKLARTKVPTGDPIIPFVIREAKAIRVLIIEKAEGATGSEEEGFAAEDEAVANLDDNDVVEDVQGQNEGDVLAGNEGSVAGNSRGNLVSTSLAKWYYCMSISII